jgi:predicted small secreted protein
MEGGGMRHITPVAIALVLLASLVLAGCGGGNY